MPKKILLVIFILGILSTNNVFAQTQSFTDVGSSISVSGNNIQDGDIICSGSSGYILCQNEYDSSMYGVVDSNPSADVQIVDLTNSQTVVSRGEVPLRVSSINGEIKKGDFLTSSKIPGVAELSINPGFVIGTALQDYNSTDKNAIGTIQASLNIHPRTDLNLNARTNLVSLLQNGLAGLGISPISALRYILASILVISSFVIGFVYFGRIAKTGVEAIGRNPLAGIRIQASVIINVAVMIAIVLVGLVAAYLVLII
ncbi:MAG TPA: hypothetical protein VG895_00715 [Patescibacteria group bacterium]|nr:hypothetical protein [Patescibacteria group bacterium]